ncbi:MAG: FMN-dependent NADH-azoreductase [Candidatus Cellulosilyticum pullistercoris]|uniref:FMN dependent NADH:quinone oxidoreductase n=1 Tax=Candidatus Cellulosilyticum pullistercoris TaxID=2838521 RepID=A0A9E2K937_9FIRM|nr:FMN-dependent NADH-azoreductase [Candidatus Cellulosilyticum pullistercoris]
MSKVLYIKANIKPEGQSKTYQISDSFIDEYRRNNPQDEIITLDLYKEGIDFLKGEDLGAIFGPKTEESKKHPILKYAYQFVEADKYVIAAPMWNLSFPAILKAYIDYISVAGITFKYTAEGPVGLCSGKKALFVASRGGDYSKGNGMQFEMGERYIRTIFAFYGITDVQSITADNIDVMGMDVDAILDEAVNKVKQLAEQF